MLPLFELASLVVSPDPRALDVQTTYCVVTDKVGEVVADVVDVTPLGSWLKKTFLRAGTRNTGRTEWDLLDSGGRRIMHIEARGRLLEVAHLGLIDGWQARR